MPKITEPLKDLQVKNAKLKDKPYKFTDEGELSDHDYYSCTISVSRQRFPKFNGLPNK
jgi:hypothetical protein